MGFPFYKNNILKITILTENTASGKFQAEHGLSYFIEHEKSILFDTGYSDLFLRNAQLLNININIVKTIVLSHGHWDHGNGLKYLLKKQLICHPDVFINRYRKNDKSYIGLNQSFEILQKNFHIITSKTPYKITENMIFLGEIPRLNDFESQTTSFIFNNNEPDFVSDDSALALIDNNQLVVISGCAHSGICNIIEYAKKISKINNIKAVIGGFHLKFNNKQTQRTIEYLKTQNIESVYPSHCTELPALTQFYNHFNIKQLKSGMQLNF